MLTQNRQFQWYHVNMHYGYLGQSDLLELMKRAGFRKLKMELESASQSTLDRLNKGITVEQSVEDSRLIDYLRRGARAVVGHLRDFLSGHGWQGGTGGEAGR